MYCQAGSPFPPRVPIPQFDLDFAEENLQELAVHFPDFVAGLLPEFGHLTGQIVLQCPKSSMLAQGPAPTLRHSRAGGNPLCPMPL